VGVNVDEAGGDDEARGIQHLARSGPLQTTDLHNFPIKFQSEDKSTTSVFKNIKLGPVSATLFEVPAGYNKMNMPMGMPGGMGGMKLPRR
jgi:hypothetical protein